MDKLLVGNGTEDDDDDELVEAERGRTFTLHSVDELTAASAAAPEMRASTPHSGAETRPVSIPTDDASHSLIVDLPRWSDDSSALRSPRAGDEDAVSSSYVPPDATSVAKKLPKSKKARAPSVKK